MLPRPGLRGRRLGPAALAVTVLLSLAGVVMVPGGLATAGSAVPRQATETPVPTALPPVDTPTVAPAGNVCPQILKVVPPAAINAAVQNPGAVRAFNQLRDAGKPESPFNLRRTWLSIHAYSKPYHPLFNSLEFKVGCP